MSDGVWLVWRSDHHGRELVGVCRSQADAEQAVLRTKQAITREHGPYYPPQWKRSGVNEWSTRNGERVQWEPVTFWQDNYVRLTQEQFEQAMERAQAQPGQAMGEAIAKAEERRIDRGEDK